MFSVNSMVELYQVLAEVVDQQQTVAASVDTTGEAPKLLINGFDVTDQIDYVLTPDEYTGKSVVQSRDWKGILHDVSKEVLPMKARALINRAKQLSDRLVANTNRLVFYDQLATALTAAGAKVTKNENGNLIVDGVEAHHYLGYDNDAVTTHYGYFSTYAKKYASENKRFPRGPKTGKFSLDKIAAELIRICRQVKASREAEQVRKISHQQAIELREQLSITYDSPIHIHEARQADKVEIQMSVTVDANDAAELVRAMQQLLPVKA